jgi:hypothetical protein
VGVQEVRWEGSGNRTAGEYTFFYGRGMRTMNWIQVLLHKRGEFVSNRMSYIILRRHWFHIIVLKVLAPTEVETGEVHVNFYEELEHLFHKFPKSHGQRHNDPTQQHP